ncbi:MAG: amidohydrolase family protein, partial [Candidatus Acidiferrales bacterium]
LLPRLDAWIYHLSEGIDDYAQQRFADLKQFGLLTDKLVAIHGIGLTPAELGELAQAGATLVWSPLGNLRLYGQTTDIRAAHQSGLRLCLGSEWAPSGSKNLLTELKVADQYNQRVMGGVLSDRELVEMVTVNPADAVGWEGKAGQLAGGAAADMVLVKKKTADPYRNLIEATEEDIELVFINGEPVYGDAALMQTVRPQGAELLQPRRGRAKALVFDAQPGRGCGSFAELRQQLQSMLRLEEATLVRTLNRLKVRRALTPNPPPVQQEYPFFLGIGDEPLEAEEVARFLQVVFPEGASPFPLDPVFVADDDEFPSVVQDPALLERGIELKPYFESLLS